MIDKYKILVVEDQIIVAKDIAATLKLAGYEVIGIAVDAKTAIDYCEERKPDLVLMDIRLKGEMTGIDAANIIYPKYNIPIIYLTAHSDSETLNKAKVTEPFGYVLKPYDTRVLITNMEMALYKHKTEVELKEKTKELEIEKRKTDELLHNILPDEIAEELKEKGQVAPKRYENITIMFTGFQGFSKMLTNMGPKIVLSKLNEIFNVFDTILLDSGLEKLKSIGDSLMVASGLPTENLNHAKNMLKASIEMNNYIVEENKRSEFNWEMKTGINSGSVIAGIAGSRKFTYDIWGDAVNIAARMKSNCKPGRINISEATFNLLKNDFSFEFNGILNSKVKNEVNMYYFMSV